MMALEYARSLSDDVTAVYVAIDPEEEKPSGASGQYGVAAHGWLFSNHPIGL